MLEIHCLLVRSKYSKKHDRITFRIAPSFWDYVFLGTLLVNIKMSIQVRFAFDRHCDIFFYYVTIISIIDTIF